MPHTVHFVTLILAAAMVQATASELGEQAFTKMGSFELGVGTLTKIQRQLGPSIIRKSGDAGEYEERLCYLVSGGTVSFLAGEVGGRNNLTGFELTSKRLPGCGRWPAGIPEPKLKIARLHLGMPKSRFATVVPAARRIEDGRLIAGFESKLPYTQRDLSALSPDIRDQIARGAMQAYWDVVVSVVARFEHQKLTEVRVWKTVTN
jgi:hypothetical protein